MMSWKKCVRLCFSYTFVVFLLGNFALYRHLHAFHGHNKQENVTNRHMKPTWNQSATIKVITGFSNATRSMETGKAEYDWSKLQIIQLYLSNCVQAKANILRCLEEAYISERREYIRNIANRNAIGRVDSKHVTKHRAHAMKMPAVPAPTDDPKLVQEFYKRDRFKEKVNEFVYDFLLTPKRTCNVTTFMVILVHTFHPYADRRHAIRSTWGGAASGKLRWPGATIGRRIELFFVLGRHRLANMNAVVRKESDEHDDIIQGDFFDDYTNMTLKSLLGLKYVLKYCGRIAYLLKSDDDMIINVPHLLTILDSKNLTRSIMGALNKGSRVYKTGKWKVKTADFPFRYYPPYEAGSAYVISNDIIGELYNMSHYVRQFHVDDAYITGVLGRIIGVNHAQQPGFAYWTDRSPQVCDIAMNKKITATKMTPAKLEELWNQLKKRPQCA